ncbi:serine protease lint [Rhopalosiphum maidis]|uniref:serine protease lint n=1 Tax=Rhopalosiphum maidis TaxID=43146 RepID=UPI000EFE6247|nr:serine protease lint [Rhopalosiphum maidis]
MSQDRLTALRLLSYCWLTVMLLSNTLAFNVVYNKEPLSSSSFQSSSFYQTGSRKFGGYRIVPRACKDESHPFKNDVSITTPTGTGSGTGVCMFNYECTQLGGSVVGSCVDVFLFGACCRLPAGVKVPAAVEQSASTATAATATVATSTPGYHYNDLPPLSFQQPVADTILLHRNGSAVQNTYRPDDLFGNFTALMQAHRDRLPSAADMTDVVQQQYTTDGGYHQYHHHQHRPPPFADHKITSKVDYGDAATVKLQTLQSYSSSSSSPVSKSTDSVPNIRKTTPSAATVQATTSKQGYGVAHHHNNHKHQHPSSAADEYYDNMVLIPTLTVNDPNVKENNSINHILSILNYTPPAPDRHHADPMDASPSYVVHQVQSSSSPPTSPQALYTWGSIDGGDSKSPGYGSSTFPVTRPSSTSAQQHYDRPATSYYGSTPSTTSTTSSHHLPGPHFHVLSTTTTTAKPFEPAAPTVIVLSPANDLKNPNKYTTPASTVYATASSSYRPPPSSHVKPSQSIIVTGKPSVSAAYTTTATYHHPQQHHHHQQDVSFVPVSSTTMADKYYNSNYQPTVGAVHTSAKPLVSTNYGHRPSTTTTTVVPPSTVSSNNNVFTTVITSVNHQYHNKFQPTATGSGSSSLYTTAKPVVNDGGAVAVLQSSSGGYKPLSAVDEDYPTPVVTPATQVFITASDVHHLQQHHIQQQIHQHLQHHTSSSSYPATAVHGSTADDDPNAVPFNSTDTFAFPPVRDPNVNLTAATQQEKPDVTVVDAAGDYDADADPNPHLTADDNLDDKVHLFVEKVVQSLQGNFEDLEKVLMSGDPSSSNVTVANDDSASWPNKKPATATPTAATTTKKPSKPATAKPTKPSPQPVKWTSTSTYRPTPIVPLQDSAPFLEVTTVSRPVKYPTLLTPVQLFQPTTYATDNKRPTKLPVKLTPSTTVVLDTLNVENEHHTTAEPDYRKTCGVRPLVRKGGRIVGGTGSTFGEWPWQVLVREATWLGLFTKNKCGGVLITQRHVITAAHCQPGFLANLVAVFGEYDISGEVESKRSISKNVKRVIVHRQYDAATFENDIALLELESPVNYDQHIVPICMPDDEDDFTGRMAVVTGWGRLKYGGGVPSILQEVQVPIIENQVCQDMFETAGHTKTILSSFLCAGYANGQRDSCEGDSGGPLMIEKDNGRWTLIGTVSHGIKCAAPYLPGVYMRTTYYKPWLQTITGVQ